MEKRIKILGEDVVLRFNMAVQLSYEEITGVPFSLNDMVMKRSQIALYMAAIIVNNPDTLITADRLMTEARVDDINALDSAMGELMSDWYNLPKAVADVIEEDNKKVARKKGGKKEKH